MDAKEKKHVKAAILDMAINDGYVTPVRVSNSLGLDGKLANKLVHELESEGQLDETWMRLYTPKDTKKSLSLE
jgi:ribosomal protein S25